MGYCYIRREGGDLRLDSAKHLSIVHDREVRARHDYMQTKGRLAYGNPCGVARRWLAER